MVDKAALNTGSSSALWAMPRAQGAINTRRGGYFIKKLKYICNPTGTWQS